MMAWSICPSCCEAHPADAACDTCSGAARPGPSPRAESAFVPARARRAPRVGWIGAGLGVAAFALLFLISVVS